MDVLAAAHFLTRKRSAKEAFHEKGAYEAVVQCVSLLIGFVASCLAAYLNWTCTTASGRGILYKVVTTAGAYFFGVVYLLLYAMFSARMCHDVEVSHTS